LRLGFFDMLIADILKKHKTRIYFFLLFFITVLLYAQCAGYGYTGYDDVVFFAENADMISGFKSFVRIFQTPVFNMSGEGDFYRPFLMLSFLIDNLTAGNTAASHHCFNILFHLTSVFLLFVLLKKLDFDITFSFLFALLFAVHPAFAHTVAWIPGRNDSLLAVFIIPSFIFLLNYCGAAGGRRDLFFLNLFYLSALFTKETAFAALIIFPVFMVLFYCASRKKLIALVLSMVLISFLYLLARTAVLPANLSLSYALANVYGQIKVILNYIEYLIIPSHIYLRADELHITVLTAIACAIGLAPAAASIFFKPAERKVVFYGLFWFCAFLLPSFAVKTEYMPHRLYLASVGLIIAYIEFFTVVSRKIGKKYVIVFLVSFALCFLFAASHQVRKFKSKEIFLANSIDESPGSDKVKLNLAEYYAVSGMLSQAKAELEKVSGAQKAEMGYLEILGLIFALEKDYLQAAAIYERILSAHPDREPSLNNLAEIYNQLGQYEKSMALYDRLIGLHPEKAKYKIWRKEIEEKEPI
jgi:hypothetical protein